jgi:hypothetical protein
LAKIPTPHICQESIIEFQEVAEEEKEAAEHLRDEAEVRGFCFKGHSFEIFHCFFLGFFQTHLLCT